MNNIFAVALVIGLPLACGGTSESSNPKGGAAGQSGHESAGRGGTEVTAGSGGSAGKAQGGAGGGVGGTTGGAGHAGLSAGMGAGAGGAGRGGAGSSGRGGAGASGGGASGNGGGAGAAGTSGTAGSTGGVAGTSGSGGMSGTGGMGGKVCGGRNGTTCDTLQYCKYEGGMCGATDETGICATQPAGIACVQGFACGCDGKVYADICIAHNSGVDTWSGNQCVPGNGMKGDACLTDGDCSSGLKCCSAPNQVISCTTPMGSGCPLTP